MAFIIDNFFPNQEIGRGVVQITGVFQIRRLVEEQCKRYSDMAFIIDNFEAEKEITGTMREIEDGGQRLMESVMIWSDVQILQENQEAVKITHKKQETKERDRNYQGLP